MNKTIKNNSQIKNVFPFLFILIAFLSVSLFFINPILSIAIIGLLPLLMSPSLAIAIYINGMFIITYFFEDYLSGYQTFGIVVLIILSVLLSINNTSAFFKTTKEFKLILLLGIVLLFSYIWTSSVEYGLFKIQGYVMSVVIPAYFITMYFKNNNSRQKVIPWIFVNSLIAALILFFENNGIFFGGRTSISGVNTIWLGRYIGLGILIGYIYFRFKKKSLKSLKTGIILLGIIILISAIIMNGSRGPIVSMIIVILLLELLNYIKEKSIKKTLQLLFLILILAFILIIGESTLSRFNLNYILQDKNVLERFDFFKSSYDGFKNNVITGVGIGGFSMHHSGFDGRLYPHNIIFEIAVETGLIGLIPFLLLIKKSLLNGYKMINNINAVYWYAVFLYFFINSLFSGDLFNNAILFTPLAVLGVLYNKNNSYS